MADINVTVHAADPITRIGLIGALRMGGKVQVLSPGEQDQAHVLVFATDHLHLAATTHLRRTATQSGIPTVLVADDIAEQQLYTAVKYGVVAALIRSSLSIDKLTEYVITAANGGATLPPTMLSGLLNHIHQLQHDLNNQRNTSHPGLDPREIEVLRLLADGHSTSEIGAKLAYSERTIKNVLSAILTRLHLRNRAHAVAYALKTGAL